MQQSHGLLAIAKLLVLYWLKSRLMNCMLAVRVLCSAQVSLPTSNMRQNSKLTALSICLNGILLIAIYHQACHVYKYIQPPTAIVTSESQPVITSTAESLYAMYGEGNFTDDDEHLLNYIRSMTSQQGPGAVSYTHLTLPTKRIV